MFCSKCGGTVNEGDAFCGTCGYRMENVPEAQQPGPYQIPPVQPGQYQAPYVQPGQFQAPTAVLPESKMLKVCSILYIILGALSIIVSLSMAASVHGRFTTAGILMLILVDGGAVVVGIIGLNLCKRPSAYSFFIAVGIAFIPLYVLFLGFGGGASLGLGIIVLAILYIVGGANLGKARIRT